MTLVASIWIASLGDANCPHEPIAWHVITPPHTSPHIHRHPTPNQWKEFFNLSKDLGSSGASRPCKCIHLCLLFHHGLGCEQCSEPAKTNPKLPKGSNCLRVQHAYEYCQGTVSCRGLEVVLGVLRFLSLIYHREVQANLYSGI